jgi:hypothetical protein
MRAVLLACLVSSAGAYSSLLAVSRVLHPARVSPPLACAAGEEPAPAAAPQSYVEAEARGFELYKMGEYERAIRMFTLAQTLPGEGIDYQREKQGGMIGSATAPPNPREWGERRFATSEQKLIADYNSARHQYRDDRVRPRVTRP